MIKLKKIDYRHYICVAITLAIIIGGIFAFPNAFGRLAESVRDFGLSVGYSFCEMFGIEHSISPTINSLPKVPFFFLPPVLEAQVPNVSLPDTWNGFVANWHAYWQLWIAKDNFLAYLSLLGKIVVVLLEVAVVAIPVIFILYVCFSQYLKRENNDYDKDSKPLIAFKWFTAHTYSPVKNWLKKFVGFIASHKSYWIIWLCYTLFCFNAFAIAFEFIGFYAYFIVTYDVGNIYIQIYKLAIDLSAMFNLIPTWAWIILAVILLDRWRKNIAYSRLNHFEMCNRGFINELPITSMDCGTMGKKKTTMLTDMALSQDVMFRDKAFEKILENDLKFPHFPWINLENEIKRAMRFHRIYNLATVKMWVAKKARRWCKKPCRRKIFNYDYNRYELEYDDKLKVVNVWDIIEIYAQLYFVYVIQSSLLIANYSIRTDEILSDLGNFPMWNTDFFKRDSRLSEAYSRHAHILDMDSLRLGVKMVSDSKTVNSFEFGVIVITEVGKERGNSVTNAEIKKKDDGANPKNDNFNGWLKMARHSATIDNFPFIKVFTDDQRPESLGADVRELCEIVHIRDSGEMRLAMPFFTVAELLHSWLYGKFADLYYRYRYKRSDNTLMLYLLKNIMSAFHSYYTRIYNRFGYCELKVQVEDGTQDGNYCDKKYYIMSKKIYSNRFSTDCFSDFFVEKALRSPVGLDDLREYESEKATFEELKAQNSYFINDLIQGLKNGE